MLSGRRSHRYNRSAPPPHPRRRKPMRLHALVAAMTLCLLAPLAGAQEKHYIYMTTPDGAQPGGSGEGLLLFDMDHDHAFVRRIDVPSFKEGVRGVNACAATGKLYVTTSGHRLV